MPQSVIRLGADCNTTRHPVRSGCITISGGFGAYGPVNDILPPYSEAAMMSSSEHDSRLSDGEDGSGHASSHSKTHSSRKHSSKGPSTSHRDNSRSVRRHGMRSAGESGVAANDAHSACFPSTSRAAGLRDASPVPPWNMVLDAIAELRSEVNKLKEDKQCGVGGGAYGAHNSVITDAPPSVNNSRAVLTPAHNSPATFSGFAADETYVSGDDDDKDSVHDPQSVSVLQRCAEVYGPVDALGADIDGRVAGMVNHVFDHGLREEEYKEILEDDAIKRPSNCVALSPVECNAQILDALKPDAKKTDHRMKGVGKDIVMAATILTKSLTVLDRFAQTGHPQVAQEVALLNGALGLLGNAHHKNNLTRRFIIKREINQKYAHLCSDKVPMTRFLFGDDVSQAAKHIEEAEKLKTKFTNKKQLPSTSRFAGWKSRGSQGIPAYKGFASRFQPYGQHMYGHKGEHRQSSLRLGSDPKNYRGRGRPMPRR